MTRSLSEGLEDPLLSETRLALRLWAEVDVDVAPRRVDAGADGRKPVGVPGPAR